MKNLFFSFFLFLFCFGCSKKESPSSLEIPKKPNIIVLITDQERYPIHWPIDWVQKNLPSRVRLEKNGLTFHRAYTAASECSPSRAVIMTGEHFPINQVARTFITPLPTEKELLDLGSLLTEKAGYEVVWKGKWHLSYSVNGGDSWSQQDISYLQQSYNLKDWNPPDAGNALQTIQKIYQGQPISGLATLGGGYANNDGRYVSGPSGDPKQTPGYGESVLDYLAKKASTPANEREPFCLFISLVNPHDVWVYPGSWEAAGYKKEDFANLGIVLPSNYNDDLTQKPSVQKLSRSAFDKVSPLQDLQQEKEYVNFYAYLHRVVDAQIGKILDALEELGLREDTVIIRTSDHGELGLSHGMREKAFVAYEEVIHVPFIVSNPKMYPTPQETKSFYCHLDLMPTLAELAGIPNASSYGKGISIVPVLKDPTVSVQNSILFTYDDNFYLPPNTPGWRIRAIREDDWTYAVYFTEDGSQFEYEMYNLKNDPGQLVNLLYGDIPQETLNEASRLHLQLEQKIDQAQALPEGISWPSQPLSNP
jgi:choline-sulfatase